MREDEGYEPFLHIVHVSDIHCRAATSTPDVKMERRARRWIAALRRISSKKADAMLALLEEGLAGHDPRAHDRFCKFLRLFAKNPEFHGIETWLLDTGDLSSMGDLPSIERAKGWLEEYQTILKPTKLFFLYGNHDAWPAKFPFSSSRAEIERHAREIRKALFPARWPKSPLQTTIPGTTSRLELHCVNSAIDDWRYNSLALGRIGDDPNWETPERRTTQLVQLAHDVEKNLDSKSKIRNFRILAVHHPIHYPEPVPAAWMYLMGAAQAADALAGFNRNGRGLLAHLVLSGHTHELFPKLGALPDPASGATYPPLTDGQPQLIAGSLAQTVTASNRRKWNTANFVPQQCQILTFLAKPGVPHTLKITRRIVGRPATVKGKDYRFIKFGKPLRAVESTILEY